MQPPPRSDREDTAATTRSDGGPQSETGVCPRRLVTADDAVSSVIASVLLVAITIVLVAAIGTFLLGIGATATQSQPTVSFSVSSGTVAGNDTVSLTHASGSSVPASELAVQIGGQAAWDGESGPNSEFVALQTWSGEVSGGDTLQLKEDGADSIQTGDAIVVVWASGERSGIVFQGQV